MSTFNVHQLNSSITYQVEFNGDDEKWHAFISGSDLVSGSLDVNIIKVQAHAEVHKNNIEMGPFTFSLVKVKNGYLEWVNNTDRPSADSPYYVTSSSTPTQFTVGGRTKLYKSLTDEVNFMKKKMRMNSLILSVCLLAGLSILSMSAFAKPTLSTEIEDALSSYTEHIDTNPVSISITDKVLYADIHSSGHMRCTLEDVKTINCVYNVALSDKFIDDLDYIAVRVIDNSGTLVYDFQRVASIPQQENISALENDESVKINISSIEAALPDCGYTVVDIDNEEDKLGINTTSVLLTINSGDATLDDMLNVFSVTTGAQYSSAGQCEVTLAREDGDVLAYMISNKLNGTFVTWVSPQIEKTFLQ